MNWAFVDRTGKRLSLFRDSGFPDARSILLSIPPGSHDEFLRLLQEACADGMRRRLSITETERPLLVVDILPLRPTQSSENPALVVLHDSSEFDSSYSRLRKLARRNEAILGSAMDGFFVVDEDCRFLEVNEAFCRMTGYTVDELLRMRISDLEVNEHANGGVPSHTRTGLHHFPTAHRHKSGHVVQLEISVNVLHDNGQKILVGFARDVTEKRRAAEELGRLTRLQQLVLDSAGEGIAGLDRDGNFAFMNPVAARMLGSRIGELIGRSAHEVLFSVSPCRVEGDRPDCPICTILRWGTGSLRLEGEFSRADGTPFSVEYSITAMREGSDVIGAVLVFRDMTEHRQAEAERRNLEAHIQQAQKLESLGLLAGGVAHDLNNTLVGVQGNACLVLGQIPDGTELHDRLQRIVTACERASKVIDQMLAYSGRVPCDKSPLDLNELIDDMTEFMRAAVPKRITLEARLEPELPMIEADNGQLQQVITNLLVNGLEAIGDRTGRITISTSRMQLSADETKQRFPGQKLKPGPCVGLQVEDTGRGMSAEVVQRIFEPFFSQKSVGRGLGLSAMHGVVRAHRGGVSVESEPERGTRFTIVFPVLERPVAAQTAHQPELHLESGSTVLVIDDEFEVRDVIKDMLTDRGLEVLTAADGTRGIEVFAEHADEIDLVLLDLTMPGKSGAEVFQELLAIRPDARVIVSSGFIEESVSSHFGEAMPAAFLHKPFTTDALMEKISSALGAHPEVSEATG